MIKEVDPIQFGTRTVKLFKENLQGPGYAVYDPKYIAVLGNSMRVFLDATQVRMLRLLASTIPTGDYYSEDSAVKIIKTVIAGDEVIEW